jgi:biopolymer transport protein ExbB
MRDVLDVILAYMQAGGYVMWPLVIVAAVMWYTIGFRALTLHRGTRRDVRNLVRECREGRRSGRPKGLIDRAAIEGARLARRYRGRVSDALDEAFFPLYEELKRGRIVIITVVSIAPLLGLLGTVSGMIETFDSLADNALFAQSGGIAGGIAEALFTTELGLCVAVPGLVVGGFLDQRQRRLEEELDQIKVLLGGKA